MKSLKLIIEAGATKSNWFFYNDVSCQKMFTTEGFNTSTQKISSDQILTSDIHELLIKTQRITYYGAGIRNDQHREIVYNIFSNYSIAQINVYSDVLAAARASYGRKSGVIVILGTGSNVSYYDGENIASITPSLGYILGDDGSGNAIGKQLLRSYFYGIMPRKERKSFEAMFKLDKELFIHELYQSDSPAKYLGQFVIFLKENKTRWSVKMLKEIFREFVDLHLMKFYKVKSEPICFVGSIAYFFQEELKDVCKEKGIHVNKIIRAPEHHLIQYHISNNE